MGVLAAGVLIGCGTVGPAGPEGPSGPEGAEGPEGPSGAPGSSCSVAQDKDGATITCDDGSTASIMDGEPGDPAPPVDDPRFGTDTSLAFDGTGTECTLGQVWLVAGTTASGTAAEGQLLTIASNPSLFSLLGTIYGGDGVTTFALPDLRDAAPNGLTYVICTQGVFPSRN